MMGPSQLLSYLNNLSYIQGLQAMALLYRIGAVDALTVIQFIANAATQYGVTYVSTYDPRAAFHEPTIQLVGTGIEFLTTAQGDEVRKRIAMVALYAATSAASALGEELPGSVILNLAQGGLNAAFLIYMQNIIELSNNNHVPFILNYKPGQGKVLIFLTITSLGCILIYYYIKLLKRCGKFGFNFIQRRKERRLIENHLDFFLLSPA